MTISPTSPGGSGWSCSSTMRTCVTGTDRSLARPAPVVEPVGVPHGIAHRARQLRHVERAVGAPAEALARRNERGMHRRDEHVSQRAGGGLRPIRLVDPLRGRGSGGHAVPQVIVDHLALRNPRTHHVACAEQRRERRKALRADVVGRPRVVDHIVGGEVPGEERPPRHRDDLRPRQAHRLGRPRRAGREQDRADPPRRGQFEVVGRLRFRQQLRHVPRGPRKLRHVLGIEHDDLPEVFELVRHLEQPGHELSEAGHRAGAGEVQGVHEQVGAVVDVDGRLGGAQPAESVPAEHGLDRVVLHRDDDFAGLDADAPVRGGPAARLGRRLGVAQGPALDILDVAAAGRFPGPAGEFAQRCFGWRAHVAVVMAGYEMVARVAVFTAWGNPASAVAGPWRGGRSPGRRTPPGRAGQAYAPGCPVRSWPSTGSARSSGRWRRRRRWAPR